MSVIRTIIEWVVKFIKDYVASWIISRGGWVSVAQCYYSVSVFFMVPLIYTYFLSCGHDSMKNENIPIFRSNSSQLQRKITLVMWIVGDYRIRQFAGMNKRSNPMPSSHLLTDG